MAIIHWRPFRYINEQFEEPIGLRAADLATDVYEENNDVIVKINAAGIDPDKVSIEVEGEHLKVSGSREETEAIEDEQYYHKEIRMGEFERIIPLPVAVDESGARAEYKDGILKIFLPKAEHTKKKSKISVKRT